MTRFCLWSNYRSGLHRSRGLANIPLNLFFVRSCGPEAGQTTVTHVPPLLIPTVDHARLDDWRTVSSALDCRSHADPVAAPRRPHRVDASARRRTLCLQRPGEIRWTLEWAGRYARGHVPNGRRSFFRRRVGPAAGGVTRTSATIAWARGPRSVRFQPHARSVRLSDDPPSFAKCL